MNNIERFNNQIHYKPVDRSFNMEIGFWNKNFTEWEMFRKHNITDNQNARKLLGLDIVDEVLCLTWMQPFSEIEITPLDWWKLKKERFLIDDPIRHPDIEKLKKKYANRDYPLGISYHSLIGRIRTLLSLQGLSLAIYDYPEVVEDMVETCCILIENCLDKILPNLKFEFACGSEDICYKNGSMFSVDFFRKILMPRYKRINAKLKKYGIDIFFIDCDGDVRPLIPSMLECGINCLYPYEVSCCGHPSDVLKEYGKDIHIIGGVDKMQLLKGKDSIKKYMDSINPLVEKGGFIPCIDHLCSSDIKQDDFLYYLKLKN